MNIVSILTTIQGISINQADQKEKGIPEAYTPEQADKRNSDDKTVIIFALVLVFLVILKNAWLSDDSYITMRTVYNFIHGYGLTWNPDERVQTYTHPLWMLLLSGTYFFVHSIYFSGLLLALIVSAIMVTFFALYCTKSPLIAVVGLTILAASKSFIDFSTSGLENPLTHLLIVLFVLVFFQRQQSKRSLFWLSLLSSMMILNRMDTVLLFLPALIYAWLRQAIPGIKGRLKGLRTILLAFIPFVLWELFSLFYYGFLFPNTAYAKLNTGIHASELFKQGLAYLISSFSFDPLLFIVIVSAVLLTLTKRDWKGLPLLLGMMLYMAYVVKIGGDFMAGRFFTPPFVMAVILLMRNIPASAKTLWVSLFVTAVLLGFFVTNSRWYVINYNAQTIDARGIGDEHAFYAHDTGIIFFQRTVSMPDKARQSPLGIQARLHHVKVLAILSVGFAGYEAGPQVHILDTLALGDPLLARLPLDPDVSGRWRIGHFARHVPPGYQETLATGVNKIQDPDLAQYYAKLHDVISGPLFSTQRLLEIWNLNTGAYNSLLQRYTIHQGEPSTRS